MDIQQVLLALTKENLNADEATSKYKELCTQLVSAQLADQAQTLLDHLITGNVPKTVSSPSLNFLTEQINKIDDNDALDTFCRYGIEKLKQFPNAFDKADANLKYCLSDLYITEDDYLKAASVLAEIDLDRGSFDNLYKATINVRIAELFADDTIGDVNKADTFIKKARVHIKNITNQLEVSLRYRVTQAKIYDLKKEFLHAANEYYRITTDKTAKVIEDEDIKGLLSKALTCAVLGAVGPQRSRMLGTLHKDKRTHELEFFNIMSSMYKNFLLRKEDVNSFSTKLLEHQKAIVSGTNNKTILEMAVLEHNMLACSNLYNNITFVQLGNLLNANAREAEKVCRKMIGQNRLSGIIDQVDGILYFGRGSSNGTSNASSTLIDWDNEIGYICTEMNAINDKIVAKQWNWSGGFVGVSNGGGGGGGGVVWWMWKKEEGRGKRERGKEIERLKNYKNTKIHARMKYLLLLFLLCAPCVHLGSSGGCFVFSSFSKRSGLPTDCPLNLLFY